MTEDEFVKKQDTLLARLPREVHAPLATIAWEQGHSNGYSEVIGVLSDLVWALDAPLALLVKRTLKDAKP